ncbi:unnamed protein product [Owenia fusiformis]|uniref:Uncharacterized protein n=1 Tax=Owenia fusiformis TaxID=6347 RepID=A0A8J1U1J3_OWEFU|nr:unnamed protein product [Owenia fusiformis]
MTDGPDKIYFPVEDLRFEDLYDWSDAVQKCKVTTKKVKGLQRQDSCTGAIVKANDTEVALFRFKDAVFAVNEKCPHLGGPLHLGDIEVLPDLSLCVKCPWHSWRFDLQTGKVKAPKGRDITAITYNVKVDDDGKLFIGFEEFSKDYFNLDDKDF